MPVQIHNKKKGSGDKGKIFISEQWRKLLEGRFMVPVFVSKDYVSFNLKNIFTEMYLIDI